MGDLNMVCVFDVYHCVRLRGSESGVALWLWSLDMSGG